MVNPYIILTKKILFDPPSYFSFSSVSIPIVFESFVLVQNFIIFTFLVFILKYKRESLKNNERERKLLVDNKSVMKKLFSC